MQNNRQKLPADFEIIMNKLNRRALKRWSIGTIIFPIMLLPLAFSSCHKPDPEPIPVLKKLDESVSLQNKNELVYTATLSNVNSAKLVVNKDGALVFSDEISDVASSGPDYQMTFKYVKDDPTLKNFTKGKYEFILTSDDFASDKLEKKSSVEESNYLPTANTTTLDLNKLNFNEPFETTLSIPNTIFIDDNLEDNPVSVTGVKSVDGKTTPTITTTSTGYDLNVKAVTGNTGAYQLELDFGSVAGGLEKTILSGTIGKDTRINYLVAPNDSTLNFYGSGDANGDNILNSQDLVRLIDVANGTFSDPNDKRLRYRCDLNGDGYVNLSDVQILQDKLNGTIAYLPSDWNKSTIEQQKDWAKKMLDIAKTNLYTFSDGQCSQYTDQAYITVHGVSSKDIPKFQQVYNYDFTNNGLFNLPLLEVTTIENDATGKLIYAHAMNAFMFGTPSIFANIDPYEPQKNHLNVQFGEDFLIGTNAKFYVAGPPITGVATTQDGSKVIEMTWYVKYDVKDKIPTMTWIYPNLVTK